MSGLSRSIGRDPPRYSWTVSGTGKTLQYLDEENVSWAIVYLCTSPPRLEISKEFSSRTLNADASCDVSGCSVNLGKVFLCHTVSREAYDEIFWLILLMFTLL